MCEMPRVVLCDLLPSNFPTGYKYKTTATIEIALLLLNNQIDKRLFKGCCAVFLFQVPMIQYENHEMLECLYAVEEELFPLP